MKKPRLRCPRCHKGGYTQSETEVDRRPRFKCTLCDHTWTCGWRGGEYALRPSQCIYLTESLP